MTQRDYRSVANSPSGTIADSDIFTFDRSGRMLTAVSGRYNNTVGYAYLGYSWDANKNKTAETIGGVMSGYGFTSTGTAYDDEDRLTGYQRAATSGSALLAQSWALKSVGDWSSVTTNGTAVTRTHGPTHELLTSGGQSVTTDVKGNQTVLPSGLQPPASSLPTATYRYVFASYIDEPVVRKTTGSSGTLLYFHRKQQYSILALTDSSGNLIERYAYTAYGQPTFLNASATVQTSSAANNRYTYTAREWDVTLGLYHFRGRWMSGLTGRFLSRDPIGYWGSEWGLYEFCDEQVLISVDPLGRFWDDSSGAGYPVQKFEWPPGPRGDPWGWLPTRKPPRTPRVKPGCRHNCGPVTNHFTNERVRCSKAGGDECRTTNPVPPPTGGWPTNGCGSMDPRSVEVPDFDYGPACNAHDVCYATCGKTKNQCDADFGDQMIQICKDLLRAGEYTIQEAERYISIAKGYQAAVTAWANFESGQDVVCQWGPCKNKYCNCKKGPPIK